MGYVLFQLQDVTDDSQGVYKAPKLAPVHFEEDKGFYFLHFSMHFLS